MKFWEFCAKISGSNYTLFIAIVANLSIFIVGVSAAWTSPILVKLGGTTDNPLGKPITLEQGDLIGSILFVGAALGPFLAIQSVRNLGRKNTLVISFVPCLIGYAILILTHRIEFFYFARLLIGFSIGGFNSVTLAYLSEIVLSVEKRGPYLAINSPALQCGFLASYAIGPYVSFITFNSFILGLSLVVMILLALCCPDSPRRIIESRGRYAAINILKKLKVENIERELLQIESDRTGETENSFWVLFTSLKYFKPFLMVTTLIFLQLFSGIAILMAYNEQIFLKSKVNIPSEQCSIIVGIVQVLSAAAITITSRKFPRKSLLIFSLFGTTFFDSMLGFYYYFGEGSTEFNWIPLIGLILFVIFYNSGLDPIPWVYLGEIYPPEIKSFGIALTVFLYWIGFYIQTFIFSKVHFSLYFLGYAICSFCGIFFVKYKVTETKGKTLKEIQETIIT